MMLVSFAYFSSYPVCLPRNSHYTDGLSKRALRNHWVRTVTDVFDRKTEMFGPNVNCLTVDEHIERVHPTRARLVKGALKNRPVTGLPEFQK